jgi:hypothetical protein
MNRLLGREAQFDETSGAGAKLSHKRRENGRSGVTTESSVTKRVLVDVAVRKRTLRTARTLFAGGLANADQSSGVSAVEPLAD